jgi:hypothetical protein
MQVLRQICKKLNEIRDDIVYNGDPIEEQPESIASLHFEELK